MPHFYFVWKGLGCSWEPRGPPWMDPGSTHGSQTQIEKHIKSCKSRRMSKPCMYIRRIIKICILMILRTILASCLTKNVLGTELNNLKTFDMFNFWVALLDIESLKNNWKNNTFGNISVLLK